MADVASHDAAGAVVGSGHLHLVVAVRHGAVVASRDAAGVVVALHAARHGQVLHRALSVDVSEEALAVVVRAVDGEAGDGVSRTVEGAGVLPVIPHRRPVAASLFGGGGQGDVRRQGGIQLVVVPACIHEGGEEAELVGRAEEADGGAVGTRFLGQGEEAFQSGHFSLQRGQAAGGVAGHVEVGVLSSRCLTVGHDGEVHLHEVVRVQVLEGADGHAVGRAALGAEHLVVGGVAGVEEAVVVVSRDAAGVATGSGHRTGADAGGEGALVVVSHDAAGVATGSGHCYLADAGGEGAVVVVSHDAAGVAMALHAARHGQVLHRAVPVDVSEEALAVAVFRAVDGEAFDGVSCTVEGAGVGGIGPYRRPVASSLLGGGGQGDVCRHGGVQLEVDSAHVHEGGEEAELVSRAEEADWGAVFTQVAGQGEEAFQFGRPVRQRGQAGGGAGACLVVVGEAGFPIVGHDGEVHLREVVLVQVLKGADRHVVGGAALGAKHLVVGGVTGVEGAVVVVSRDAAGIAVGSGHCCLVDAGVEGAVVLSRDAAGAVVALHRCLVGAGDEGAGVMSRDASGAVGSVHLHLVGAVRHGAVVVSRDAAGVVAALHAARHGQVLHRALSVDVSEEALAVVVRAVDGEAGDGVSRTVEGAGVLPVIPHRRPVAVSLFGGGGQGDVRRQGGVQSAVVVISFHVHEVGKDL